jgi:membrane associated rhomboid family serine protease
VLPLKDDVPTQSFPLVTVALIGVNLLVFLYEFALGLAPGAHPAVRAEAERAYQAFIFEFGLIPCRIGGDCPASLETLLAGAPAPWLTVFTSMFVHGGLFHVGGNMLYLWIFGNNVEDSMGKGRFLVFYLVCGVAAAIAQYLTDTASPVPMVGASGAVSGALGAYLIMFPGARVWTLMGFGFIWRFVPVPAVIVLGFWIVVQVINGVFTFGRGEPGGVAFLAHVGGFVAGMALVSLFRRRPRATYRRW